MIRKPKTISDLKVGSRVMWLDLRNVPLETERGTIVEPGSVTQSHLVAVLWDYDSEKPSLEPWYSLAIVESGLDVILGLLP